MPGNSTPVFPGFTQREHCAKLWREITATILTLTVRTQKLHLAKCFSRCRVVAAPHPPPGVQHWSSPSLECHHFNNVRYTRCSIWNFRVFVFVFVFFTQICVEIHSNCRMYQVRFFLLLSRIPSRGWTTVRLAICPLKDVWVIFSLGLLQIYQLQTSMDKFFCDERRGIVGSCGDCAFTVRNWQTVFWSVYIILQPPVFPHPRGHFVLWLFFILAILISL